MESLPVHKVIPTEYFANASLQIAVSLSVAELRSLRICHVDVDEAIRSGRLCLFVMRTPDSHKFVCIALVTVLIPPPYGLIVLDWILTVEQYRNKGHASRMIRAIDEAYMPIGFALFVVTDKSAEETARNIRFYERFGFHTTSDYGRMIKLRSSL